jgi:tellurite resistance protein TehA-like permease
MASGIVSRAVGEVESEWLSGLLLGVAVGVYALLVVAVVWRTMCHRHRVARELRDPGMVFGYFTFVAASDVLATRLADGATRWVAEGLLGLAVAAWLVLAGLAVGAVWRAGPGQAVRGADGAWFLIVVGLQSAVLAAASLWPGGGWMALAETIGWWCGVALYALITLVVGGRLTRFGIRPPELTPVYWVTMGAGAISVLAGSELLRETGGPAARQYVAWGVLAAIWLWATSLWPLLVAGGVWRHLVHRVSPGRGPAWWALVFPVGMYAVATAALGTLGGAGRVVSVGHAMAWGAFAAWLVVAVAVAVMKSSRLRNPANDVGQGRGNSAAPPPRAPTRRT